MVHSVSAHIMGSDIVYKPFFYFTLFDIRRTVSRDIFL